MPPRRASAEWDTCVISHFCTYFDHLFLARGMALYSSIARHCPSFRLWILCLDDDTYGVLRALNLLHVQLISRKEFEAGDEGLASARIGRTTIEYYFTLTPSLPLYVFRTFPEVDLITYLDSDIFFFGDPASLWIDIGAHSIAIIEHRFAKALSHLRRYGIYNVGWVSFRNDKEGIRCLNWWRQQCLEWCFDRVDGNRFADQRYLDDWVQRLSGVVVLKNEGANVAPWNAANLPIRKDKSGILIGDSRLLFFHFHGLRRITDWLYSSNLSSFRTPMSRILKNEIYKPYIRALLNARQAIPAKFHTSLYESHHRNKPSNQGPLICSATIGLRRLLDIWERFILRDYILLLE